MATEEVETSSRGGHLDGDVLSREAGIMLVYSHQERLIVAIVVANLNVCTGCAHGALSEGVVDKSFILVSLSARAHLNQRFNSYSFSVLL